MSGSFGVLSRGLQVGLGGKDEGDCPDVSVCGVVRVRM